MKGDYYKSIDKDYGVKSVSGLEQIINGLAEDAIILEIGCGSGHVAGRLKDNLPQITASDLELHCLITTKKNYPSLKIFSFDAAKPWPLRDECLDLIFSSNLYEHLNDGDLYIKEGKRVLKIGGVCLISTPHIFMDILWWCIINPDSGERLRCIANRIFHNPDCGHSNLQTKNSLRRKMKQMGLQPEFIKRESLNSTEIEKIRRIFPFGLNILKKLILSLPGWLQPTIVVAGKKLAPN